MKYPPLHTRLVSFPISESYVVDSTATAEQQKKQARIESSLQHTTSELGFLHACLVQLGNMHFAVAGPSSIGKSTLAEFLVKKAGGQIIANDWVAVEKDGTDYFASDLNHSHSLKHTQRCKLSGIIILTEHDDRARDAFIPTKAEAAKYIATCFDNIALADAQRLAEFWVTQLHKLPYYCVLPTRDQSVARVQQTLLMLLRRIKPSDELIEVGIIGTGSVGSTLASELGQLPYVHRVHLYNRSKESAVGLALDLNQALYRGRSDIFVAHDSAEDVFSQASDVFFAFRERQVKHPLMFMPERWAKLEPHANTTKHYAELASKARFNGTIFVITNPVDILTYACYAATQKLAFSLRTFQIYGIGLEADMARALFYGRLLNPLLRQQQIELFGNHSDEVVCATKLPIEQNDQLLELVKNASQEVRSFALRTTYGPVAATLRTYDAFVRNRTCCTTVLQQHSHIGRNVSFRHGLPLLSTNIQHPKYSQMISENQRLIKQYQHLF